MYAESRCKRYPLFFGDSGPNCHFGIFLTLTRFTTIVRKLSLRDPSRTYFGEYSDLDCTHRSEGNGGSDAPTHMSAILLKPVLRNSMIGIRPLLVAAGYSD